MVLKKAKTSLAADERPAFISGPKSFSEFGYLLDRVSDRTARP